MRIDPERGSGRTWRLVADTRPGDFYVVLRGCERWLVREMLDAQGRASDELRIIVLEDDNVAQCLRGYPPTVRVYVDHAAFSGAYGGRLGRAFAELEEMALRRHGGLHMYPVAEPCDTGSPGSPYSREQDAPGISRPSNV